MRGGFHSGRGSTYIVPAGGGGATFAPNRLAYIVNGTDGWGGITDGGGSNPASITGTGVVALSDSGTTPAFPAGAPSVGGWYRFSDVSGNQENDANVERGWGFDDNRIFIQSYFYPTALSPAIQKWKRFRSANDHTDQGGVFWAADGARALFDGETGAQNGILLPINASTLLNRWNRIDIDYCRVGNPDGDTSQGGFPSIAVLINGVQMIGASSTDGVDFPVSNPCRWVNGRVNAQRRDAGSNPLDHLIWNTTCNGAAGSGKTIAMWQCCLSISTLGWITPATGWVDP